MAKPLRNILQLTLATTSERSPERTLSLNNKHYCTKACDKVSPPQRGCLPWETCIDQKCPKRSSKCTCPSKKTRKKPRPDCGMLERCVTAAKQLFQPEEYDFDMPDYDAKTYPLMQGAVKRSVPGAPMPGWEKIQKTVPKKPEGC